MRCYLDTSAIVKWFVDEDGSDVMVAALEAAAELATCRVAYTETRAVFAALHRAGRLDEVGLLVMRTMLDGFHWQELQVVEVTAALAERGADLAERHALRGFDALHLAAALELAGEDLVVATWDGRLWDAARIEGVAVLPAGRPGG